MNQLFEYLDQKEKKENIKMKRTFVNKYNGTNLIKHIKHLYYLDYNRKILRICNYDFKIKSFYSDKKLLFEINENIYSILMSTLENKIFVCLSENEIVKI